MRQDAAAATILTGGAVRDSTRRSRPAADRSEARPRPNAEDKAAHGLPRIAPRRAPHGRLLPRLRVSARVRNRARCNRQNRLELDSACRNEYHEQGGDLQIGSGFHTMRSDLHSPVSIVDALRAILVVDKLPVGFLLGAGCPASIKISDQNKPLIPVAAELTRAVVDSASGPVAESLRRLQAMLVADGQADPTIEHMLTRVRAMETIVGEDEVRGFSRTDLQCLEKSICRTISDVVNKPLPESATPYHSLVKWIG